MQSERDKNEMSPFWKLLFFILVDVITERKVESFLLNGHANVSGSPLDNGYYNIYSKIDYLEKALQNLEASVQQKETHVDTLFRQVQLEIAQLKTLIKNGNSMFHMI